MPYSRVTWVDGTTALSAEHMNNLEEGVSEALTKSEGNNDMWSYIRNLVYPVGSIYMSATLSTHEAVEAILGGTWEAWGSGRVPVGVGTSDRAFAANETGGASTVKLTAAQSGVPAHTHTTGDSTNNRFLAINSSKSIYRQNVGSPSSAAIATIWQNMLQIEATPGKLNSIGTNTAADASSAHNNLQPYITCYMYKRIV